MWLIVFLWCYSALVLGGSLKLNFNVNDGTDGMLVKKDGSVNMPLLSTNNVGFYFAELGFGSNNETIVVSVDTGSADLWITSSDASCYQRSQTTYDDDDATVSGWAVADSNTCKSFGSFDESNSTSFSKNTSTFDITYADGTFARGYFGDDSVSFGGAVIHDVTFGLANASADVMGTLGLGLPGVESVVLGGGQPYENFLQKLKNQGIIDRGMYSLYLNEAQAKSGVVLFGAVDHEKYQNELVTTPMLVNFTSFRNQVIVKLDSMSVSSDKNTIASTELVSDMAVLLDSGTTFTGFSNKTLTKLAETLGGGVVNSNYYVDCKSLDKMYLTWTINNSTIKMPMSKFAYSYYGRCYLSFSESDTPDESSYMIIGQDILRELYVVYDLEGLEISLAKAYYTEKEDIEIVGSDGAFNRSSPKHKNGSSKAYSVSSFVVITSMLVFVSIFF